MYYNNVFKSFRFSL